MNAPPSQTQFVDPVARIADTLALLPEHPGDATAGDLQRLHDAIRQLGNLAVALEGPHDDLARTAGRIDCDADAVRAEAEWLGAICARAIRAHEMATAYVLAACPEAATALAAHTHDSQEGTA